MRVPPLYQPLHQPTYQLELDPGLQELRVQLHLDGLTPGDTTLLAPGLAPGDTDFQGFNRALREVRAFDPASGAAIEIHRHGWSCYTVQQRSTALAISYRVAALRLESDTIALGGNYLRVTPHDGPCRVRYTAPPGWAVRHPAGARALGNHLWEYWDYEQLLGTPVWFEEEERHALSARVAR